MRCGDGEVRPGDPPTEPRSLGRGLHRSRRVRPDDAGPGRFGRGRPESFGGVRPDRFGDVGPDRFRDVRPDRPGGARPGAFRPEDAGLELLDQRADGRRVGRLTPTGRALLDRLVALYLDRLPPELAAREASRLDGGELHFAWAGPTSPGRQHYYRVQGDDLLIEYDNTTDDGNHAHTVLRHPATDFGPDPLTTHHTHHH
nr:DUF3500 domain-containing protein [Micromonospora sp. R77]